jgi:hypothetical protein
MGLPSRLFPSGFPTKTLFNSLLSLYVLHAPPISSFLISSPEQYWARNTDHKSLNYVVFSTPPLYLVPLRPNILLSTLFSNTLSLRSSLNVSDHVSHPYKQQT